MTHDAVEVIIAKRDGHALADSQIDWVNPARREDFERADVRIAVKAATVKEDISARKKFIAPVTVPICGRATEFCSETTLTGNVVPRPSAKIDSTTNNPHRGSIVSARTQPEIAATDVPIMATRL